MGPPSFSECYLCHKEFGSKSLEIHAPQCLQKWRRQRDSKPKDERNRTPSPPQLNYHPDRHKSNESPESNSNPVSDKNSNGLSNSWPDSSLPFLRKTNDRPGSSSYPDRKKQKRPSTATLSKPKILDPNLKDTLDMSEMSRQMMQLVLVSDSAKGSSDYSSDFSSSSPSSLSSKSPFEDDATSADSETEKKRPSTMRLKRPTSHISVPVINASSRQLPRRGKTATMRSHLSRRLILADDLIGGVKEKVKQIPEPCMACGKDQNPERFHTHPHQGAKFKAKEKRLRELKTKENQGRSSGKTAVTKPTALKYTSKAQKLEITKSPLKNITKRNPGVNSNPKMTEKKPFRRLRRKTGGGPSLKNPLYPLKEFPRKKIPKDGDGPYIEIFDDAEKLKSKETSKNEESKAKTDEEEEYDKFDTCSEPVPENKEVSSNVDRTNKHRVCYICGREFGSRSLGIHEPQCLEKWKRENNSLAPKLRRAQPERPDKDLTKEEWNEYAWKISQAQLIPCENCGRTFFPDRLEVHQRGCKPQPGSKKPQETKTEFGATCDSLSSSKMFARPTVVCYLCGREFGSKSIAIHEPQCLQKWKNENDKLPPNMKRDEPKKPEIVLDDDGKVDKEATSEAAWQTHLQTLVKCGNCKRTFFPDRLVIHQKSCKTKSIE